MIPLARGDENRNTAMPKAMVAADERAGGRTAPGGSEGDFASAARPSRAEAGGAGSFGFEVAEIVDEAVDSGGFDGEPEGYRLRALVIQPVGFDLHFDARVASFVSTEEPHADSADCRLRAECSECNLASVGRVTRETAELFSCFRQAADSHVRVGNAAEFAVPGDGTQLDHVYICVCNR